MFYLIGISFTFFLVLILAGKKGKSTPDNILMLWLITIGTHLFVYYLFFSNLYIQYPFILGIEKTLPLFHGVFLFLYTLSLTTPDKINYKIIFHLIPILMVVLIMTPFLSLDSAQKINIYKNEGRGYETISLFIFLLTALSGVVYSLISLFLLTKHKKNIQYVFSNTDRINLNWLKYLIYGIFAIWIMVIFGNDQLIFTSAVLFVFFIGYYGIKQTEIFTDYNKLLNSNSFIIQEEIEKTNVPKYEKSSLSLSQLNAIKIELEQLMSEKEMFKTPELTIEMVAEELNIHSNLLSEVINRAQQKNFFEYINQLRIDEFKIMIQNPENKKLTLLGIALECGFNSKTSFNRNFKLITGKTPSQYIKEIES